MNDHPERKLLIVANVSKEHIRKFHIPFINYMRSRLWRVDVACRLDAPIPECDRTFDLPCHRNPFRGGIRKSALLLRDIIRDGNYDAVVCNTLTGGIVTRLARLMLRRDTPCIIYINHGLHYFKGAPLHRWILGFSTERMLVPLCDVFVAINDEDYEIARRTLHPRRIEKLNGIGIDLTRFGSPCLTGERRREIRAEFGFTDEDTVITYTAEINRNKNQKLLIRAMQQLDDELPHARLLLIGPEHDGGRLRRLAVVLGLSEKIKFAGWRDDILELLAASDIYAASSLSEGLPVNVLEAMAAGLPVVAAENRGHAQLIRDGINGFLVPKNDARQMARRIAELYRSPEKRAALAEKAREDVEKYGINAVLAEEERIILTSLASEKKTHESD